MRGENLDGYGTIEACVSGPIDLAHSPGAHLRQDLIRSELCTRSQWHNAKSIVLQRSAPDVYMLKQDLHGFKDAEAIAIF